MHLGGVDSLGDVVVDGYIIQLGDILQDVLDPRKQRMDRFVRLRPQIEMEIAEPGMMFVLFPPADSCVILTEYGISGSR